MEWENEWNSQGLATRLSEKACEERSVENDILIASLRRISPQNLIPCMS